jgi:hypothetical protein
MKLLPLYKVVKKKTLQHSRPQKKNRIIFKTPVRQSWQGCKTDYLAAGEERTVHHTQRLCFSPEQVLCE